MKMSVHYVVAGIRRQKPGIAEYEASDTVVWNSQGQTHGSFAGAWFGGIRPPSDSDATWQGATLKQVTNGLSRTILTAEQVGRPDVYVLRKTRPSLMQQFDSPTALTSYPANFLDQTRNRSVLDADTSVDVAVNFSNVGGIYSFHRGAYAAFCDGSVRFLSQGISTDSLAALLTRSQSDQDAKGMNPEVPNLGRG